MASREALNCIIIAVDIYPSLQTHQCLRHSTCFSNTHSFLCLIQRPRLNIFTGFPSLPISISVFLHHVTRSQILLPRSAFRETKIKTTGNKKMLVVSLKYHSFLRVLLSQIQLLSTLSDHVNCPRSKYPFALR